jgi:predicted DNA-binding protein YlxM (UPF0122 family)
MDYRVKVTIRNDRILSAIEDKGFVSVLKFSQAYGLPYVRLCDIIRGSEKPINEKGEPIKIVKNLLNVLEMSMEEAFTERQLLGFKRASFEIKADESKLAQLVSPIKNGEQRLLEKDFKSQIREIIDNNLSKRYANLLKLYFGIDKDQLSIRDIALIEGITHQRVADIIKTGIEKLKSPVIKSKLINTGFLKNFSKLDIKPEDFKHAEFQEEIEEQNKRLIRHG